MQEKVSTKNVKMSTLSFPQGMFKFARKEEHGECKNEHPFSSLKRKEKSRENAKMSTLSFFEGKLEFEKEKRKEKRKKENKKSRENGKVSTISFSEGNCKFANKYKNEHPFHSLSEIGICTEKEKEE